MGNDADINKESNIKNDSTEKKKKKKKKGGKKDRSRLVSAYDESKRSEGVGVVASDGDVGDLFSKQGGNKKKKGSKKKKSNELEKDVKLRKKCGNCGRFEKKSLELLQCGGCLVMYYCSENCQKNHWKKHKPICEAARSLLGVKARMKKVKKRKN